MIPDRYYCEHCCHQGRGVPMWTTCSRSTRPTSPSDLVLLLDLPVNVGQDRIRAARRPAELVLRIEMRSLAAARFSSSFRPEPVPAVSWWMLFPAPLAGGFQGVPRSLQAGRPAKALEDGQPAFLIPRRLALFGE